MPLPMPLSPTVDVGFLFAWSVQRNRPTFRLNSHALQEEVCSLVILLRVHNQVSPENAQFGKKLSGRL